MLSWCSVTHVYMLEWIIQMCFWCLWSSDVLWGQTCLWSASFHVILKEKHWPCKTTKDAFHSGGHLPSVQGIYNTRCLRKARNIVKDHSHPGYGIFTLLPSGRRYLSIRTRTTRLTNSFFPQAVRPLNQQLWSTGQSHSPFTFCSPIHTTTLPTYIWTIFNF